LGGAVSIAGAVVSAQFGGDGGGGGSLLTEGGSRRLPRPPPPNLRRRRRRLPSSKNRKAKGWPCPKWLILPRPLCRWAWKKIDS